MNKVDRLNMEMERRNSLECSPVMYKYCEWQATYLSWLYKFAYRNEKLCETDRLNDYYGNHLAHPKSYMKFSFNPNDHNNIVASTYKVLHNNDNMKNIEDNSQRIPVKYLSQTLYKKSHLGKYNHHHLQYTAFRRKYNENVLRESNAGSIRRNCRKNISESFDKDNQIMAVNEHDMLKLAYIYKKLDKALSQDKKPFCKYRNMDQLYQRKLKNFQWLDHMEQNIVQVGSRQLDHKRDSPPKKHRPREIQQAKLHEFYNQQSCLPILYNHPKLIYRYRLYIPARLKAIFTLLDIAKTGVLSKFNCNYSGLREYLKFVFGSIFSKITLKDQTIDLAAFTSQCSAIFRYFSYKDIKDLLINFASLNSTILKYQQPQKYSINRHPYMSLNDSFLPPARDVSKGYLDKQYTPSSTYIQYHTRSIQYIYKLIRRISTHMTHNNDHDKHKHSLYYEEYPK